MAGRIEMTLAELGITLPSPAYIVGAIVFGIVGLAAFVHGKRAGGSRPTTGSTH